MKSNFSPSNPFPISAKAHFWEMLNQDGKSQLHLDFGAHDGKTIIDLVRNGVVKKAIGLAYVPSQMTSIGSAIYIEVRKKRLKAKIVSLPFYKT